MFKNAAPCFLLATPTLLDPNFHQSVVLLFHHSPEGALGVVVNRETQMSLSLLLEKLEMPSGESIRDGDERLLEQTVLEGGPVSPEAGWVVFEGDDPSEQSFDLGDGLQVTGSLEVLQALLTRPASGRMSFTLGYAGWGPGQLEMELEEGAWMPAPVDRELLFGVPCGERWRRTFLSIGVDPALWSLEPGEG